MKKIDGWLSIDLEGFAQQNIARPKEHLVKELLQNSLDAVGGVTSNKKGNTINNDPAAHISLSATTDPKTGLLELICQDNGQGVVDIENIRTMFWTSKKDSHLNRGRMGRGFKELLCLCKHAQVTSLNQKATFLQNESGTKELWIEELKSPIKGTIVQMKLGWNDDYESKNAAKTILDIGNHINKFLLPANIHLSFNSIAVAPRLPKHTINCKLITECFDGHKWIKPAQPTSVELYPLLDQETTPLIYEMGIPICPVEWDAPYHVNVLQRVPMNPNRDAVMSGYASKVHKACLPKLIDEITPVNARSAWVGEAAYDSKNQELQLKVLKKAFGDNLARSVPGFGKFDHDADAAEVAQVKVLDTKQLSGGFRNIAKLLLPTSKEVAQQAHKEAVQAAKNNTSDSEIEEVKEKYKTLLSKYGKNKINLIVKFHKFMADNILEVLFPDKAPKCTVKTAIMAEHAEATWSDQMSVLTLALDLPRIWERPFDKQNFSLIIHETAHELAAHHGNSFANAVEDCAGAACKVLIDKQMAINSMIKEIDQVK
jgi:hypothetical protein